MYIRFTVKFPERNWTDKPDAFEALRRLLPAPSVINVPPNDAMTEPASLVDIEGTPGAKAFRNGSMAAEEDDEDGHPHAERVQCASQ
jgi:DnaJ family protein A protein 2